MSVHSFGVLSVDLGTTIDIADWDPTASQCVYVKVVRGEGLH